MNKRKMINKIIENKERQCKFLKNNIKMYEFYFDIEIRKWSIVDLQEELVISENDLVDEENQYNYMSEVIFNIKQKLKGASNEI